MQHLSSYPTVYALGHRAIADIFKGEVVVQEKVDGSQISFASINCKLCMRSKGKDLIIDAPEKMFIKAVESIREIAGNLVDGWVYRGEYLQSPKHNTLAYSRVPQNNVILFDVMTGPEMYLSPQSVAQEARRIGLESVPLLFEGVVEDREQFAQFLERESILGGCKIEGVVVKNYNVFTPDKKIAIGKYVSEAFKEKHQKDWKALNPGRKEVVDKIIAELKSEARWRKAIQHLKESGVDTDSPRCIGEFIREIQNDVQKEEAEEIRETLFKHFWPQISRGIIAGAPEWFKQQLTDKAFQH